MTEKAVPVAALPVEESSVPVRVVRVRKGQGQFENHSLYDPVSRFLQRHCFVTHFVPFENKNKAAPGTLFVGHSWKDEDITSLRLQYVSKKKGLHHLLWTSSLTREVKEAGKPTYKAFSEDETTLNRSLVETMIQAVDASEEEA